MEFLKYILSINSSMINIFDYQISYIEFTGTCFGLISVWLATKANIHTWTIGIADVIAFFIIYYQVQLYSDMFLQVFFLGSSILGIFQWLRKNAENKNMKVSAMNTKKSTALIISILFTTILLGYTISRIHILLPELFNKPAAFPYADAFTTVLSIYATFLMAYKRVECWYLWILVDLICIFLYVKKGILFISLEYCIFLIMATWGLIQWQKSIKYAKRSGIRQVHAYT